MSNSLACLMPHRAPMRWIDALVSVEETAAVATVCFQPEDWPVREGRVLETALVECVAQAVAAAAGQRARAAASSGDATGPPGGGMLAAVTNFCVRSTPPAGKPLRIEVRELRRFGSMLSVSGKVFCEGELIASGELKIYA